MSREDAIEVVTELLAEDGVGKLAAHILAVRIVDALGVR